jgi:hypothetical protein
MPSILRSGPYGDWILRWSLNSLTIIRAGRRLMRWLSGYMQSGARGNVLDRRCDQEAKEKTQPTPVANQLFGPPEAVSGLPQ